MHMALSYYESKRSGREEKTREVLRTMGSSILLGGASTFLGIMLLAFTSSEIFRTIFITYVGVVALGVSHGLVFFPVVLSLVGPNLRISSAYASIHGKNT